MQPSSPPRPLTPELEERVKGSDVLVTGGCGFIGSHLVKRLLELGAREVMVVDSLRYGNRENLGSSLAEVSVTELDLADGRIAELEPLLERADFLIHLAAEKHNQSRDQPSRVLAANIAGTFGLFELAARCGVRRTVFSSSLYAYGRMHGPAMCEDMTPLPNTIYGITKLTGEQLLGFAAAQSEMSAACLRYFFVYGPKQFAGLGYKSVIAKNFERIARGEAPIVFGDGEQSLDYSYVDDVVEATLAAAVFEGELPHVMNIGSGEALSINTLTRRMLAVAGSDLEPVRGPADWTHGTERACDPSLAAARLGYRAMTDLDTGLERTFAWVKENLSS